jgi:hypothetical protein
MNLKIEECNGCGHEKPIVNRKHGMCTECNFERMHGESRQSAHSKRARSQGTTGIQEGLGSDDIREGLRDSVSESSETELTPYEKFKQGFEDRREEKRKAKKSAAINKFNERQAARKLETVHRNKTTSSGSDRNNDGSSKEQIRKQLKKKYNIKSVSSKAKYRCSDGSLVSEVQIKRKYAEVCDQIMLEREMMCQGSGRWDVPLSRSHTISRKRCKELNKTELIWTRENLELEGYEEPTSNPTMAHNIWECGTWEQKSKLLNWDRKCTIIKLHDPEGYAKIPEEFA